MLERERQKKKKKRNPKFSGYRMFHVRKIKEKLRDKHHLILEISRFHGNSEHCICEIGDMSESRCQKIKIH